MSNYLLILSIQGELDTGCLVTWEALDIDSHALIAGGKGKLPSDRALKNWFETWSHSYLNLASCFAFLIKRAAPGHITNLRERADAYSAFESCRQAGLNLVARLNEWLSFPEFGAVKSACIKYFTGDRSRLLIKTESLQLRRLPWESWDLIKDSFPHLEIAFTSPEFAQITKPPSQPSYLDKVRILAIFGSDINSQAGKEVLAKYQNIAQLTILESATKADLDAYLTQCGWDILFFAGHSTTKSDVDVETGIFQLSATEKIAIADIKDSLKVAIQGGLKLAIFNSCDGLGLAKQLAEGQQLYLPQIAVMRHPIPDKLAPHFLDYFLESYTQGASLLKAIAQTRLYLSQLETEFPCASWLPVVVENPAEVPPLWIDLGRRPTNICPYQGLAAFQIEDAPFFFGREAFVNTLLKDIESQQLVAVLGDSGVGKSSVVLAGLIPKLSKIDVKKGCGTAIYPTATENNKLSSISDSLPSAIAARHHIQNPKSPDRWQTIYWRPGSQPDRSLAVALHHFAQDRMKNECDRLDLEIELTRDRLALTEYLQSLNISSPILLIADQLEELYTFGKISDRQLLLQALVTALECVPNFKIVLTLRSDFLNAAFADPSFFQLIMQGYRRLELMDEGGLREAIEKPAQALNVLVEPGLTELILETLGSEPGSLPLLEFTLTQLWEKLEVKNGQLYLSLTQYHQIGGVKTALADRAEVLFKELNAQQQKSTERLFLQLVYPSEPKNTKRIATRAEIGEDSWKLVDRLAAARLLTAGRNAIAGLETVEIVHEALIQHWWRLQGWLLDNQQFRVWQEQLRVAVNQWEGTQRDSGGLWRGNLLQQAEKLSAQRSIELSPLEKEFIKTSQKLRARQLIQRISVVSGFIATLSTASWFVWGLQQESKLQKVRNVAQGSIYSQNSILSILPYFLNKTQEVETQGKMLQAIQDYADLNLAAHKLGAINIANRAENGLARTIKKHHLPELMELLRSGNYGKQTEYNFSKLEKQFTGGLRLTYAVLMTEVGANSDRNRDGILDEGEEIAMPCETLAEIERLWRQATQNRCYWYGALIDSAPKCRELGGKSLTAALIYPPAFAEMEKRLQQCRIVRD